MKRRSLSRWSAKPVSWLVAVAFLTILVILLWPRQSLAKQASDLVEATLDGDVNLLWDRSVEKLRGDSGLTIVTVERLFRELIKPRLAGWTPSSGMEFAPDANPSMAGAGIHLRHRNGKEFLFAWNVYDDGNGVGKIRLCELLPKVWLMEYISEGGDTSDPEYVSLAKVIGLRKDIMKLRQIGLKGIVPKDPSQPILTLDVWLKNMEERVRKHHAQQSQ